MRRIAPVLLTTCLLCACGQKGNLYLPDSEREAVPASSPLPAASPAPGSSAVPMASPLPAAAAGAGTTSAEERERENTARNKRSN